MQQIRLQLSVCHRPFNFEQAVDGMARFLKALRLVHPQFGYWEILGKDRFEPLQHDLADLGTQLAAAAKPRKKDRGNFTVLDSKGNLLPESLARFGFRFYVYTAAKDARGGMDFSRPDHVEVSCSLGAESAPGTVTMTFPATGPSPLLDHARMQLLVETAIQVWNPNVLNVGSRAFLEAIVTDPDRPRELRAGWFNYLRHPLVAGCLPSELPGRVTRLGDEGILFNLANTLPDPENDAHVATGKKLQALFDRYHLDEWHVVAGLTLDAQELAYKRQVVGSPADRGYVVAFTVFDGYDAQRGVLLLAGLFKAIANGGSFSLNEELLSNRHVLEGLYFVVLARQQLSALEYAGASNPIEWHIGNADLAGNVRVLLNDWLHIPDSRLAVRYTPAGPA